MTQRRPANPHFETSRRCSCVLRTWAHGTRPWFHWIALGALAIGGLVSAGRTEAQLAVTGGGTGRTAFTQGYILFGAGTNPLLTDSTLFWDNTNKRLGIGTTAPLTRVDVAGIVSIRSDNYILKTSSAAGTTSHGYWWSDGTVIQLDSQAVQPWTFLIAGYEKMRLDTSGRLGIGTTSPAAKLNIYQASTVSLLADGIQVARPGVQRDYGFMSYLYGSSTMFFGSVYGGNPGVDKGEIALAVSDGTTTVDALHILGSGNVGIGTTTPTNKLHVAGNITVDGNINAKYQDVAEWVPASGALPAGTVVVIDGSRSNAIVPSSAAYDTRIAGVVTETPGLLLGEAGEDKAKVATTGRVRVRATASNGSIRVGDLLVTSDLPGLAMKSVPAKLAGLEIHRPGTLVGKALEPLSEGEGEILVLLSLQ